MKRVRVSQILLAALLASAAAGAASAADVGSGAAPGAYSAAGSAAYPAAHRGAYSVTFTVSISAAQAPGTTYLCKARAVPNAPSLNGFSLQALPATSSLTAASSSSSGSWANCTVEIPFYWIGNEDAGLALLSYEIDEMSGPGAQAVPVSIAEGIGVPYPAPGGTARLSFSLNF